MANQPRQLMILQLVRLWGFFDNDTQHQVREFFGREASIALNSDARNAPMLITAILFMQSTTQSPEALASLRPMLQQLQEIAPNRAETHQLLANQALKEGRYADALSIAQEYQSVAPDTNWFFAGIERAALEGLNQGSD
jgi:tetratricopeptide (TPR) repeat protein